jgi:hypothetical protein
MPLNFDLSSIDALEFGVGRDTVDGPEFVRIPTDEHVKNALKSMATQTWAAICEHDEVVFAPSERYASMENLVTSTNGEYAGVLTDLHYAVPLPIVADALSQPERIFCYFSRFTNPDRRRLTCVRRATQFKGILKSKLIQVITDALRIVEERTFKFCAPPVLKLFLKLMAL